MRRLNWWKTACAAFLVCVATTGSPALAQFTTLANFDGSNGSSSLSSLVQGLDGSYYATTAGGGANFAGTVYKVTPLGTLTTLYSFCSQPNCTDGASPYATLLLAADGNFYGTTSAGGANSCFGGTNDCGTVFKITPRGTLTTLYSFCSETGCADGANPDAGLVLGVDGNLFGTTTSGGISNNGTVYKVTPGGTLTTLYTFTGGADGRYPVTPLVQGANGDFYGTASSGADGGGTVFSITAGGTFTVLFSFAFGAAGADPLTPLIQAGNGSFYGTTYGGGDFNCGTVFEITPSGTLTGNG